MTIDLQSRIIINVAVGMGYSKSNVNWEDENGNIVERNLTYCFINLIE